MIGGFLREEFSRNIVHQGGGARGLSGPKSVQKRVDYRRYNGAALLGLRGLVFKSHGSADELAFGQALDRAYDAARNNLLDRVQARIAHAAPLLARREPAAPVDATAPFPMSRIRASPAPAATCRPRRVTNATSPSRTGGPGVETSDQWIVERTGIRARHFAAPDVTSSDLGARPPGTRSKPPAARRDIDLIIVATSTPDMVFPSSACILQNKLGIAGCPAFDVQAVCSGFVYALTVADAMIRTGSASCALVVGAEVFSRILDFNDRTTCVLFGDGAGAVVLEARDARHPGQRPACRRQARRHPVRARAPCRRQGAGHAAAADGRPGRVQAGGGRARRAPPAPRWPRPARPKPTSTG
jgi:hypothetical protein